MILRGTIEGGLPLERDTGWHVGSSINTSTDVVLVRVDDPASGKIWLISKETVAQIPDLYAKMRSEEPVAAERVWPEALTSRHLLGISLAQWLGWFLSIPLSWVLAWLFIFLVSVPRRIWFKLRRLPFQSLWETPPGRPLRCILAIVIHTLFVYQLDLPLLYRAYYARVMAGLLAGCFAWFLGTLADRWFRPRGASGANPTQRWGVDPDPDAAPHSHRDADLRITCSVRRVWGQRTDSAHWPWYRRTGDRARRAKDTGESHRRGFVADGQGGKYRRFVPD